MKIQREPISGRHCPNIINQSLANNNKSCKEFNSSELKIKKKQKNGKEKKKKRKYINSFKIFKYSIKGVRKITKHTFLCIHFCA